MARSGPFRGADFLWNPDSASASRLADLMLSRGESVNGLAPSFGGRRQIQRWLDGSTISEKNRQKLAAHFDVSPDEFLPVDPLEDVRPLLERVEAIRRERGMRVGTIVGVVKRLAAR